MDREIEIRLFEINERITQTEFAINDASIKAENNIGEDKYQGYLDLAQEYANIKNALEEEKIRLTNQ